jgi:hypothetical protein
VSRLRTRGTVSPQPPILLHGLVFKGQHLRFYFAEDSNYKSNATFRVCEELKRKSRQHVAEEEREFRLLVGTPAIGQQREQAALER